MAFSDQASAELTDGPGATGIGVTENCQTFSETFTGYCSQYGDGGASWKIFTSARNADSEVHFDSSIAGMNTTPADVWYNGKSFTSVCSGYKYVAVYTLDGRIGYKWENYHPYYWGPFAYGSIISGSAVASNGWGITINGDNINTTNIMNGSFTNGARITDAAALKLYQDSGGGNSLSGEGYFCFKEDSTPTTFSGSTAVYHGSTDISSKAWLNNPGSAPNNKVITAPGGTTSYKITFKDTLRRTDSADVSSKTRYSQRTAYRVNGGSWTWKNYEYHDNNGWRQNSHGHWPWSSLIAKNGTATDSDDVTASNLNPGDEVEYCHSFWFRPNSDVTDTDFLLSGDTYVPSNSSRFTCVTVKVPYKLTINSDYANVTVTRTSSPYSGVGTGVVLVSGAAIYPGDVLKVDCSKKNDCSNWVEKKFNTTNVTCGSTYTVSGDTTVSVKAALREYSLTKSQATGTAITVNRTKSEYGKNNVPTTKGNRLSGNASTGSINSGAIYCGDTIRSTFSLNTGYSWGNYNWSSNTHQWGYHFQGANTGGQGDSWNTTGPSNATNHDTATLPSSLTTYTVDGNVTAETQAVEDKFQGRARVNEGTSIGSGPSSTGYVSSSSTTQKTIECANEGCNAFYDLYAKTTQGTGPMKYRLGTSRNWMNNGAIGWIPTIGSSSVNPSTTGTKMDDETTTLYPGQSMCRYLQFTPLGTSSNTADAGSCMHTIESLFQGKVTVSGNISGTSDWQNTGTTNTFYANNCTNGCTISFTNEMKRTQGIGSTDYTIARTSNLTNTVRGISAATVKTGTFRPSTDTSQNNYVKNVGYDPSSGTYTLYPGMKVCEKLTFKPSNNVVDVRGAITITTCALALGNSQPGDPDPDTPENPNRPSGDSSFINIKVRNNNVTKYNNYQREVYAKPGDVLSYRSTYNPTLQYTYYLKPQSMRVDGGTAYANPLSSLQLGSLFTYSGKTWRNGFSVLRDITTHADSNFNKASYAYSPYYLYTNGIIDLKTESTPLTFNVFPTHVSQAIDEKALTNWNRGNSNVLTTPGQVTFDCTQKSGNKCIGDNQANVSTATRSNIAYAHVPYNFNVDTRITTPGRNDPNPTPVYAGEETNINFEIDVKPRANCTTTNSCNEYATKVDDSRWKIIVYRGNERGGSAAYGSGIGADLCRYFGLSEDQVNCGYSDEGSSQLNASGSLAGSNGEKKSRTFYAQDLEAGDHICVAAAVYPSNSGAETNWKDKEGNHQWRISDSKCYTIAKRPSLQVWGGNFYSTGKVTTSVSTKNNINGYTTGYTVGRKLNNNYIFGSWGELGVISVGAVNGFASAAATGYAANFGTTLWPSYNTNNDGNSLLGTDTIRNGLYGPGGNKESTTNTTICLRRYLTFANYPCLNTATAVGNLGGTTLASNGTRDKSAIIETFMRNIPSENKKDAGSELTLSGADGGYWYTGSDLRIQGSAVTGGTHAVESNGNITITGDLVYEGNFNMIYQVPKIVIYARKNINISCSVARVDAVLIADGTVTTCAESTTDMDKADNSRQLKVNGTIIASRLIANRTYGAAAGANSIIPAEIINYDASLYLWGSHQSDSAESGKLHTTYTTELSPRY